MEPKTKRPRSVRRLSPLLTCLCFLLACHASLYAQQTVRGTVVSGKDNTPMPGVTVLLSGTTTGVTTSDDGTFAIQATPGSTLIFSMVGYLSKEIKVSGSDLGTISLDEDVKLLESVVVVGYGTQKKLNVTGAITTLDMTQKEGEPTTNISNSLAGMPGMFVHLGQSQPGVDRSQIRIRGMGTLSDNDPLVLVDGIEYSIDELNPDDVETVTVLKDASAAIYGSRAANGVILITTKTGRGKKSNVNYNYYYGIQQPTMMPDVIWDPIAYMKLKNQAMVNQGKQPNYSDAEIAEYESGMATDPITYPANNWFDIALKNGQIQKHNISFSGSADQYQYRLSLGYMNRDGIIIGPKDNEKKYSIGLNTSVNVTDRLEVGLTLDGYYRYYEEPFYGGSFFNYLMRALPILTDTLADGRYGNSWLRTPGRNNWENPRMIAETGYSKKVVQRFLATIFAKYELPFDIHYNIKFGADKYDGLLTEFTPQVKHYNPKTGAATNWNSPATAPRSANTDYNDLNIHFYNTLDWSRKFADKHTVGLMLGASYDHFGHGQFLADMTGYLDATLTALSAGSERRVISGNTTEDVLESYFGRLNYDFGGKYLLEGTFRYDGSSRFAPGHRWGFFPSVSAGWLIDR
ncbi:MAG TPA: SusC/RagA family TonB-linked outer membrane protein, partial [Chryseosolibacter sp.]